MNQQAPARTPFVPAWLDDAGLSASEFRVLCRVARRGDCTESGPNIAKGCKLHPDTAWDALKSLEAQGLITKEKRHGKTGVFRVQPPTVAPSGIGGVAESEGHPLKPGGTQRKEGGTHLAESEGHKGSPIKVLPKGGKRASARECGDLSKLAVPEKLNTVLFQAKWADWIKCRQGKAKVKDWAGLFREQLEWLAGFEEPTAREILSTSIRNGWQGLFPPKANGRGISSVPDHSKGFFEGTGL